MKIDIIIETGADKRFEAVIDPGKDYGLSFGLLGEGYFKYDTASFLRHYL